MPVHDVLRCAAVAAAIGVFSAVTPAAAQSAIAITAENVMHFEVLAKPGRNSMGSYGQYDRAGDTSNWIWKTPDGSEVSFVADHPTSTTLVLKSRQFDYPLSIDLVALTIAKLTDAGKPIDVSRVPITNVSCDGCDLRLLRPLQGEAGLGEVMKKKKDIDDDLSGETIALKKDPIKVVHGFGRQLFVLDHHHGALAWIKAEHPVATCQIINPDEPLPTDNAAAFWSQLQARNWVRLADKDGNPIAPEALPQKLTDLPNDPYRTLAWMIRSQHRDGFCRSLMLPSPPPFAEFKWADWMRKQAGLPIAKVEAATDPSLWKPNNKKNRETAQAEVLEAALQAAKSPDAAGLPGYRGDKPADYHCPVAPGGED